MKVLKVGLHCIWAVLLVVSAGAGLETGNRYIPLIHGYASLEAGEIMRGYSSADVPDPEIHRAWLETGYVGLGVEANVTERLKILIEGEMQPFVPFRRTDGIMNDEFTESRQPRMQFAIKRGEGIFSLGSSKRPNLQIETGFFPYKYNHDVKNLGEFLFRTYCYPPSIVSQFDKPYADLVGLRLGGDIPIGITNLRPAFLLTSSTNFWPFMNWSPTFLFDYSLTGVFSFGAGIQRWNLFPVGVNNSQVGNPTKPDSIFTFAGTKLMSKFCFDVKGLLPEGSRFKSILGKDDLKVYGEFAVLGTENYQGSDTAVDDGYEKRLWRKPKAFGLNWFTHPLLSYTIAPALLTYGVRDKGAIDISDFFCGPTLIAAGTGIVSGVGLWLLKNHLNIETGLDVLSIELEYQDSPYPNSITQPYYYLKPFLASKRDHAKLKWSLYTRKDLGPHVSLIFQAARDHTMPQSTVPLINFSDYTDVLLRNTDWWWTGKVRFSF